MSTEELANGNPEKSEGAPPAAGGQEKREEGGRNNNGQRGKKDETPIEELFDLSKPIPRVPKPNKEEYEKQLDELNGTFESLKDARRKVQDKIEAAMDKDKKSEFGKEREILQGLRKQKNALIEEKKSIRSKLDLAKSQADKIMKDKKDAKSNIRFGSVEEIEKEIKKLQRKQETTSMSLSEEKRIIKEMDALKASKKFVVEIKSKDSAMENVKEQRKNIQGLLSAKDKEIDGVSKLIDEKQAALKVIQDKESNKKNELQVWFKERDEMRKKINETLKEKDAVRAKYREENNQWYNFQRAVRAQKRIQIEDEKKQREAEHQEYLKKMEEEEAKKIPYEEEQALCDYLADYLTRTYLSGTGTKKVEKASDVVAVKDDPFAGFKPVKKDTEEEYFGKGKGKKKRVRASKKQDKAVGPFTLSVDTFEQFGWLSLSPPTSIDMVEGSVKELREKKEWYSKQPRGSVPTASQIRKANEKAAEKIRKNSDAGETTKTSNAKAKFSLSSDDFAPLGGGGSGAGVSALNSSWGQKPAEAAPAVVSETEGAATEEA